MIDKTKQYTLQELLDLYNMYNIEFKYYGNNGKGNLELFLKTDADKVSVFKSIQKLSKYEYLKLDEKEARNVKFVYEKEVDEVELDIVAIVLRTSDVNIPAARYTLKTLDELIKIQDKEKRENNGLDDGIVYFIVDNNTACTLYDDVYLFGKDNGGLIKELEKKLNEEKGLNHDNLKLILDYYKNINNEKEL